jgi:signal transduction histidine kinase
VSLLRPSVRLKLTLLYGVLFVTAGLLLIAVTYGLVRRELAPNALQPLPRIERQHNPPSNADEREAGARREERRFALRQLWRQSLVALGVTTLGALALGWLLAGEVLHPIQRITAHAKSSSATTLDERIHLEGPDDELKELADTFDAMLDRLQAAFRAQQGFAAQASHELRTPLAIIRAEAEVAGAAPDATEREQQSAVAILTAVGRSERLVDGLLALTRSESTMLDAGRVDLADLTGDVVGEYVGEADQAHVRLDLALDSAEVRGDPALLQRMVGNLVQNAIRYNVPDGTVQVSVRSEGGMARLAVENSGPEVNQDEIDQLFQPFVRGDWARRNRTGFGLGLAIVRSVATAHSGTVRAIPGPNGGLRVIVDIPLVLPARR